VRCTKRRDGGAAAGKLDPAAAPRAPRRSGRGPERAEAFGPELRRAGGAGVAGRTRGRRASAAADDDEARRSNARREPRDSRSRSEGPPHNPHRCNRGGEAADRAGAAARGGRSCRPSPLPRRQRAPRNCKSSGVAGASDADV
ncbi:MAG: Transcriptional regulator, MarR family, partial [uncultured Sphingosinicella sp.]